MTGRTARATMLAIIPTMFACAADEGEARGMHSGPTRLNNSTGSGAPAVREFVDRKGRKFVLEIENVPQRLPARGALPTPSPGDDNLIPNELGRDELAEALRPLLFRDGHQYRMATPDYEAADLAIAMRDKDWFVAEPARGSAPADDLDRNKHFCCGTDGRTADRNNTAFPQSATVVFATHPSLPFGPSSNADWQNAGAWCSGTFIGASTAISAAHCFHDGTSYYGGFLWGAGADRQDPASAGSPIPNGFPQAVAEYWVYVPSGYNGGFAFDYAVLDFSPHAIPTPGSTVGNFGFGCPSEAWIESHAGYAWGYPGDAGATWPQIRRDFVFGKGVGLNDDIFDVTSNAIIHQLDTSGGDSGQPFGQYDVDVGPYVTGVHHGHHGSSTVYMKDRRASSDVCSFVTAQSVDF